MCDGADPLYQAVEIYCRELIRSPSIIQESLSKQYWQEVSVDIFALLAAQILPLNLDALKILPLNLDPLKSLCLTKQEASTLKYLI